jgi:ArsR family transcriptional regulator
MYGAKMLHPPMDLATFEARAHTVAALLKAVANPRRLMVLCKLVEQREMTVGDLAAAVGLSQSALSQHLARLREEGLVATRREGQSIYYRLADAKAERLLQALAAIYCPPKTRKRN